MNRPPLRRLGYVKYGLMWIAISALILYLAPGWLGDWPAWLVMGWGVFMLAMPLLFWDKALEADKEWQAKNGG